jgi:anaerobic ribonucleoside-triphosphate reductase
MHDLQYKKIKQLMQMMLFELNQMYISRGGQVIFSSINCSPGCPKVLENSPVVYAGKIYNGENGTKLWTYKDLEREIRLQFKALMELSLEGDSSGKLFPFPKIEVAIEKKFTDTETWNEKLYKIVSPDFDEGDFPEPDYKVELAPSYNDLYRLAFNVTAKYGILYFDNLLPERKNAENSVGCTQCITNDTLCITKTNAGLQLEEIDTIKNYLTPFGIQTPEKTLRKQIHEEIYQIRLDNGMYINATKDHALYINGTRTNTEDIKVGDTLDQFCKLPIDGIDNPKLGWFAGWYAAEGNMLFRDIKTGGHRLQISLNVDEEEIGNELVAYLKEEFKVNATIRKVKDRSELRILVYNKEFMEKLVNMGFPEKTGRRGKIPDCILNASDNTKWEFVHAFCKGEGSRYAKRGSRLRVEFYSDKTAQGLMLIAQSLGIEFRYGESRVNKTVTISNKDALDAFDNKEYYKTRSSEVIEIKKILYDGIVIDPIDLNGHQFILGNGIVSGNCCSYSFSTDTKDDHYEDELNFRNGYFFRLGGMQAASINMPRLAYKSDRKLKVLMAQIFDTMDTLVLLFKEKKKYIEQNKHRLQYLTQKGENTQLLTDFDSLVYEIGIVGINEMCQYHTGKQLDEGTEAIELAEYVLSEMQKYTKLLSEMHKMKIVLARTPAETVAQKFAVSDLMNDEYREKAITCIKGDLQSAIEMCKSGNRNLPIYYSNGFAPYVGSELPLFEKINIEDKLWPYVDGGAITHIWLGEENPNPDALMEFAFNIFRNTNIGYLAFTKDLTQCVKCKNIQTGLKFKCDKCGSEDTNWYSRVTGYYSMTNQIRDGKIITNRWNNAKLQELTDRKKENITGGVE